jgi:hypothetical protein
MFSTNQQEAQATCKTHVAFYYVDIIQTKAADFAII